MLNEEDVFSQLERYGFEFYDPDQEDNHPLDFNQADIIIAPHGAALANLVFCQPGTKVLELIPTDHPFGYFYTLSQTNNLNYAYLMGQSEHVRKKSRRRQANMISQLICLSLKPQFLSFLRFDYS